MRRFRPGLQIFFKFVLLLTLFYSLYFSIERYVFEEHRQTVQLAVNHDDFVDLVYRDGLTSTRGYNLLLEAGIRTLVITPLSLRALHHAGSIQLISGADLQSIQVLTGVYPTLLENPTSFFKNPQFNSWFIIVPSERMKNYLMDLLHRLGCIPQLLAPEETGNPLKQWVLRFDGYGENFVTKPQFVPTENLELLRKMGFTLYLLADRTMFDLSVSSLTGIESLLRQDHFRGVLFSTANHNAILNQSKVSLDKNKIINSYWQKLEILLEAPLRQSSVFALGKCQGKIGRYLSSNLLFTTPKITSSLSGSLVIVNCLPVTTATFIPQIEQIKELLQQNGLHLGERILFQRSYDQNALIALIIFYFTLLCLVLLKKNRISPLVILSFFVVFTFLICFLLFQGEDSSVMFYLRYLLALPMLLLITLLPLRIEEFVSVQFNRKADVKWVAVFYVVLTFLVILLLAPFLYYLFAHPYFIDLNPQFHNSSMLFLSLFLLSFLIPLSQRNQRRRFMRRFKGASLYYKDLLLFCLYLGSLSLGYFLVSQMSQIPHASWLAGSHIWLIGIPALQLFYQARLRRRTGFAWLISPFFIFATAGIAVELMQPFSLPIGTRIYFLLRIIFFGLIISFLIHLFSGRIKELFSDTAHSGLRRVRVRKGGNDD